MKKILLALSLIGASIFATSASAELARSDYEKAVEVVDAKAGSFAKGMIDNRPGDEGRRDALLQALGAYQNVLMTGVDAQDDRLSRAAESAIVEATRWADIIKTTDGVMQMRPFWEQASKVLMSRLTIEEAFDLNVPQK